MAKFKIELVIDDQAPPDCLPVFTADESRHEDQFRTIFKPDLPTYVGYVPNTLKVTKLSDFQPDAASSPLTTTQERKL